MARTKEQVAKAEAKAAAALAPRPPTRQKRQFDKNEALTEIVAGPN